MLNETDDRRIHGDRGSSGQDDMLTPLERLPKNKLILGLFLPMQEGAWSPSRAPRSTSWTFDYLSKCTLQAEEFGFDLAFGLAQWMSKGGLRRRDAVS